MSLLLNGALLLGWALSLLMALGSTIAQGPLWWLLAVVLLRSQLQTGLFIVAHDAMHGLLCPRSPGWNDRLGAVSLLLYAGLPFEACRQRHQRHHLRTATPDDPDVPQNRAGGVFAWYYHFLARYLSQNQMLQLLTSWALLVAVTTVVVGVPPTQAAVRVVLFSTLPLLLSSWQLFIFGTYLPHRVQRSPERRSHPISLNLPPWLSLLACFHFGYHREHHDHPQLSWYELPGARVAGSPPVASDAAVVC